MNFAVQRTTQPDGICVTVAGEIDIETAPQMRDALLDALALGGDVIVDLSSVTFMDSAGLADLVRAHQQADRQGVSLRLRGVTPRLDQLLQITGLDSILTVETAPSQQQSD